MYLQRLIYVSETTNPKKDDLKDIEASSQKNNVNNAISGVLCFNANYYIQVLEGSRARVSETFSRIHNDPRHTNVELISCTSVRKRLFENWSMLFIPLTKVGQDVILKYSVTPDLRPKNMDSDTIVDFCCVLAAKQA